MLKEFKLRKAGTTASVEILGPEHLAQVLALQDDTRHGLPDAQKMFVLPQQPDYFEAPLKRQNGMMIGIRVNGQMVAQMVLMGHQSLDEAVDKQRVTRNDISFYHAKTSDLTVIAKSMAVHPLWRGNDLSQNLLECIMELPLVRAADHIFAQISVDNVRSWELFLRHGFGIVAAAIDPSDKKPRFIVQRPALGFAFHHTPSVDNMDPVADFAAIMRLTQGEALIGRLDEGDVFKLSFYADAESAAAWYDLPARSQRTP
jgi:hypothetical protein